jgi:hypothetical protein
MVHVGREIQDEDGELRKEDGGSIFYFPSSIFVSLGPGSGGGARSFL